MKTLTIALTIAMLLGTNAWAGDSSDECSTRMLAGRWMFATDVGKQTFFPGGDITAIGTFRVDRAGNLKGKFDATIANFGTSRTDSIVVVSGGYVRGMSQDVQFLWTYDMRRL